MSISNKNFSHELRDSIFQRALSQSSLIYISKLYSNGFQWWMTSHRFFFFISTRWSSIYRSQFRVDPGPEFDAIETHHWNRVQLIIIISLKISLKIHLINMLWYLLYAMISIIKRSVHLCFNSRGNCILYATKLQTNKPNQTKPRNSSTNQSKPNLVPGLVWQTKPGSGSVWIGLLPTLIFVNVKSENIFAN